jgi:hypothetical protein
MIILGLTYAVGPARLIPPSINLRIDVGLRLPPAAAPMFI